MQQAYEELRAEGVGFLSEPAGATPAHGVANLVRCRDPDGLVIEPIQFLPRVAETGSGARHSPEGASGPLPLLPGAPPRATGGGP